MHIRSKSLPTISLISVGVIAAALAGFELGTASAHKVMAASPQTQSPAGSVAPSRDSYADIVDRVAPAVVTIHSARRVRGAQQFPSSDDPFFQQFFGNRNPNRSKEDQSRVERALGSGVIVTADGYILTNHHVVDGADQISIELNDRRSFEAKLIGSDAPSDLALLKIEASGLPVLPLGNSESVRVGDLCLAVGNPLGIGETVTAGIISAKGRATGLSDGSFEDFLQTDAAINQGNSGGALVNTRGELIGINSQIVSPSGGNIGIGFAIPSNMAKNVMDQLRNGGKVTRGRLGVGIQEITSDLAKSLGLHDVRGVLVNSVDAGGPAESAGIRPSDIITAVNGVRVDDANSLRNHIAGTAPGTDVTVTLLRDGREVQVHARLTELPADKLAATVSGGSDSGRELGISVKPGSQGLLVTEVDPSSPAAEAGIQTDDVIVEVNRQPVRSTAELRAALRRSDSQPALVLLNRGGRSLFLAIKPK